MSSQEPVLTGSTNTGPRKKQKPEFDRFAALTKKLVNVPKSELDKRRKADS
jgi:hypothetical protein